MARPLIAVTDSVFPSLDPALAALARVDPDIRMAKSASADDILAVARDADAILVTYAKLPGELLRQLVGKVDGDAARLAVRVLDDEEGGRRRREYHADAKLGGGNELFHCCTLLRKAHLSQDAGHERGQEHSV